MGRAVLTGRPPRNDLMKGGTMILKNFLKGLSAQQRAEMTALEIAMNASAVGGIPRGKNSQVYIVDPQTGSDSNDGLSFETALATLD